MNKKLDAGVGLIWKDEQELCRIKDNMDNPIPLDENHPGWKNLIPKERRLFKKLRAKDDDDELTPHEQADFEALKDIIKNGNRF